MKENRKLIIIGIPHHGNLGDNAIAVAEENLIDTYFSEYKRYVMAEEKLNICAKKVKKFINDDDILLLHGGGNLGDTYDDPENGRRTIIQEFPNNKIIIFPQTAYFSDTEKGREVLEKSKKIYNAHKDLTMIAREKKSFKFMKEHFYNAKIYLTPDIVMTLKRESNKTRNGGLLLFRNDKEKTLENDVIENIKSIINENYGSYKLSDMNVGDKILNNVGGAYRTKLLEEKFNEFETSEIVITDRLHGMIFAAITETPCIVFSNFNHKIIESYDWLKDLGYIKFCDNADEIESFVKEMKKVKSRKYDNSFALDAILPILKNAITN